jgi:hypothetical protein
MRLARWSPLLVALAIAGCGSSGGAPKGGDSRLNLTTPKPQATASPAAGTAVTRREAAVIRGWADTLRHGHVIRAARYFALPSVIANGADPVTVTTREQAEQFNRVLSCGAKVVTLERAAHHHVIATFRLTDRPGGDCGPGLGNLAYTAFLIRGRRITEWLRVPEEAVAPSSPS